MKSLKDLAKELGVSTTVVSHVYHGKWRERRIGEALATRVRAALEREGCRPSHAGSQLKTGRSMTVGVLLPDFGLSYWMEILKGIESVLTPSGFLMLLASTRLGAVEAEAAAAVLARGVDGLLVAPYTGADEFARTGLAERHGPPVVLLDTCLPQLPLDFVVSDNRAGAVELVRRLLAAGRRRIAYLGGAKGVSAAEERYLGYLDALRLFGLAPEPALVKRSLVGTAGLPEALDELLALPLPPDALFVESFLYFRTGFDLLGSRHCRVPERLMLAGFDAPDLAGIDSSVIAPHSIVKAEQDGEAIGRLAATRLKELVLHGSPPQAPLLQLRIAPRLGPVLGARA